MDNFAYCQNFGYMMPPQQQQVVRVNGANGTDWHVNFKWVAEISYFYESRPFFLVP